MRKLFRWMRCSISMFYRNLISGFNLLSLYLKKERKRTLENFSRSVQYPIVEPNNPIDFRVSICLLNKRARVSFTLHKMRLLSPRRFLALIFTRNILPPASSQAIVRSGLSARWIQIVLRQQGYNPVDIKLAILDFAKFALLNREGPYVFLRWQIQMAYYICCAFLSLVY